MGEASDGFTDGTEATMDAKALARARGLGAMLTKHPVVARLKRLEEKIREDPDLRELWTRIEASGGGGCGSCGCATRVGETAEDPDTMALHVRFGEEAILQDYVQIRSRFYRLVDAVYGSIFEAAYGSTWMGAPVLDPVGTREGEAAESGIAVSLVDSLGQRRGPKG